MKYLKKIPLKKDFWIDFFVLGVPLIALVLLMFFSKPINVGDGSQYYALALAWKTTWRPFMTDASWTAYGHLVNSGRIIGLVTVTDLKGIFPTLTLGSTADFGHFWFYSLCASIVAWTGQVLGMYIPIHTSFLIAHCFLFTTMLVIARKSFGRKGVAVVSILTFLSPIIWYVDKVHTEFFTYCLTTSAVILFIRKQHVFAAFFLALASTQNISFAAISLFVLGIDALFRRHKRFAGLDAALLVLSIALMLLHPVYYFFRYGTVDPLFYAGQAITNINIKYAYIWFFDPDLGLFPNWPLSIVALMLALIALRGKRTNRLNVFCWLAFVACYTSVSILAQSSTPNLNSGATPGIARYALWYLGLFFPAMLIIADKFLSSKWVSFGSLAFIAIGLIFSVEFFRPTLPQEYNKPSLISFWIQKHLPNVYNPPPEIFAERYGGVGEDASLWKALAVVGPDCQKILLISESFNGEGDVLGGKGCGFDPGKLSQVIRGHLANGSWGGTGAPTYVRMSGEELAESRFIPTLGNWYMVNIGSVSTNLLINGWSIAENWGTWSDGKNASLALPCWVIENQLNTFHIIELELTPFIAPSHLYTKLTIHLGTSAVWSGSLVQQSIIQITLPDKACEINNSLLRFAIDNPVSPLSLGISSDNRKLGIGLLRIRFVSSNP